MRGRLRSMLALVGVAVGVGCSGELPSEAVRTSAIVVHVLTPATIRSLIVQISGPGIDPELVVNIPVGEDSVARDTLEVPAGSARRFIITAVDTGGVATHRGDTTVTLVPGVNPPLAIVMRPLGASVGITVTFGDLIRTPARVSAAPLAGAAATAPPRRNPEH